MQSSEILDRLVARVRFRHLSMLLELRRTGTIGKAAARLHLTQPALSKALKEIEDAFGFPIFRRGARGLAPTPAGQAVLNGAAVLLAELGHLNEVTRLSRQEPAMVLHLGAPSAIGAGMLPAILAKLRAGDERVIVRLSEDPVTRLFERLVEGELDALLTSYNQAVFSTHRSSRLVYEHYLEHKYVVIAPTGSPLARKRVVTWKELLDMPWILPDSSFLARQALEGNFLRAGVAVPEPVVTSNHPATTIQLVAAGVGVSAVLETMMHAEARIRRVARVRVESMPQAVPTALVYRAGSADHPQLLRLREAMAEMVRAA